MGTLKARIAKWTWRFETTNRYINIVFRFVWLAMFCKIFNMKVIGYVITGVVTIILFILMSWAMDRFKMIDELQEMIWNKTPQWHEIKKKLKE